VLGYAKHRKGRCVFVSPNAQIENSALRGGCIRVLAGQYYDEETQLHYNYFRYYDPTTGRYITSDPIGLDGGLNTYSYVEGNPLVNIDPYGLSPASTFCAVFPRACGRNRCVFVRDVYYGGACKSCIYNCPGYGAPVVFQQAVGKSCPSIGQNGLVNTSEIDDECRTPGQCS